MEIKMSPELLSRAECNALRGLAIIGIFLHNYCHWLNPVVKENEYRFFRHNVDWFAQVTANPDLLWPAHILSFFGHYGVPIFLFLSAYGLERKYGGTLPGIPGGEAATPHRTSGHSATAFTWHGAGQWIAYHFLKLFKMMIVGFVAFTIVDAVTPGRWHYTVLQIIAQLGMFNNLLPDPDHNIWPGPYWFFGLMLQLYIVYRLLLWRRHWGWTAGLMTACLLVQLLLGPESDILNRYRYNFMGGMLPFGMGLLFARYGERIILINLGTAALAMSFVVTSFFIVSMSGNYVTWTFVPAFVCYAAIYLVKLLRRFDGTTLGEALFRLIAWMGTLSAALFVIHPVLRKIFIPISRQGDVYAGLLLYVIASIGAAWLVKQLMDKIPTPNFKH